MPTPRVPPASLAHPTPPWGAQTAAPLVPLLVLSLNRSEHLMHDLVRVSKHSKERHGGAMAAFPDEDMAEWEREPSSCMAEQ